MHILRKTYGKIYRNLSNTKMSSRVLKKLHGDNDLEICEQELSDADNDIGTGSKKKQFEMNRYDLVRLLS